LELLQRLGDEQGERHSENTGHLERLEDMFKEAFPDGDAVAHRRYHEALIRKAEERTKFWIDLRIKLAEKGIWAVIGMAATAMYWYYVKGGKP